MPLTRRQILTRFGYAAAGISGFIGFANLFSQPNQSQAAIFNGIRGETFLEPPRLPVLRSNGSVSAEIFALNTTARIGGLNIEVLTYNGSVPGSTLRLKTGEILDLKFTNQLEPSNKIINHAGTGHTMSSSATNLHLHGPLIAPSVDNPFAILEPSDSRSLRLELPQASAGTHWYHPHPHGQVAPQLFKGLAGTLIVEGELDTELRDWEEHILVFKDFAFVGNQIEEHRGTEKQIGKGGNIFTVNGQVEPVLRAKRAGLWLRMVNASTARPYRLALENHALHLIATDGHTLEKPIQLTELLLAPGQRADVLIQLERQGTFRLNALPYSMPTISNETITPLMSIVTNSSSGSPKLPQTLVNLERLNPAQSVNNRVLTFKAQGQFLSPKIGFPINDLEFDINRTDISAKIGTLETWEIINYHAWDLPFHLHSYPFQVLEINGKAPDFRAWHDVINLKHQDRARILIPFRGYTGKTVYHCHISEHEDAGMMGILKVKS
jgi:FtsP/CotA-like multicopper oxidase with cupredoxin domain